MLIKIQCGCGQSYEFEAIPVDGRLDGTVACPTCGADGTAAANTSIAAQSASQVRAPRRHTPLPGQATLAQAKHEARAKIMWGDQPGEVKAYLVVQGYSREAAAELVDEFVQERVTSIRGNGLVKLLGGCFLVAIPIVTLLVFLFRGMIYIRTLLVTVVIGFVGVWLIIKGAMMVFAPKSEPGEVTEA